MELNQLFQDMSETVVLHDADIMSNQQQTEEVVKDTRHANKELDKGVKSARRARKLKWFCIILVLLILIAVAVVLIIKFKVEPDQQKKKNGNTGGNAGGNAGSSAGQAGQNQATTQTTAPVAGE